MEEEAARQWLVDHCNVPRETLERLEAFIALLRAENEAKAAGSGSAAPKAKAKNVIFIWQQGGPPHQDTWDMKPDAPTSTARDRVVKFGDKTVRIVGPDTPYARLAGAGT